MQVEVSKYTEGVNEKELRPNGLPKSLIRYDGKHDCSSGFLCECYFTSHCLVHVSARQKEKALGSIVEVLQTVKHPHSHIHNASRETTKNHEEPDNMNLDYVLPKSAGIANMSTPGRKTPQADVKGGRFSQEASKKSRKSWHSPSMRSVHFL